MKNWKLAILIAVAIVVPIGACLGFIPLESLGAGLMLGAVAANQVTRRSGHENRVKVKLNGGEHLYEGTLVFYDAGGYATATAGGNIFAGVLVQEKDATGLADGAVEGEVYYEATFVLPGTGFTQADVGKPAFASDNYTVTATEAGNSYIGQFVEFISSTAMRVKLEAGTHPY